MEVVHLLLAARAESTSAMWPSAIGKLLNRIARWGSGAGGVGRERQRVRAVT